MKKLLLMAVFAALIILPQAVFAATYSIVCNVKDTSNMPIHNAVVVVTQDVSTNIVATVFTNPAGSVAIDVSSPGDYFLGVSKTNYSVLSPPDAPIVLDTSHTTATTSFTMEYAFPLFPGWNFVSFPKQPYNSNINAVFKDTSPNISIVWGFDGQTQGWLKFKPSGTNNTLAAIEGGKGYWIHVNTPQTGTQIYVSGKNALPIYVTLSANDVSPNVQLYDKWNLVGYYGADFTDPSLVLQPLGQKWSMAWYWTSDTWYVKSRVIPNLPLPGLTNMITGKAYWVRVNQGGTQEWSQSVPSQPMAIIHGPRLGLITNSEATISWDTNNAGTGAVKYGTGSTYPYTASVISSGTNYRAALTGLAPETTYRYQVTTGGATSEGTFTTGPATMNTPYKFIYMADTRGPSDQQDLQGLSQPFNNIIADAVKRVKDASPGYLGFAINGGDLFYGYTADINQMRALYSVYKGTIDPLAKLIPYLASPGGHEMSPCNSYSYDGFNPLSLWNEQIAQPSELAGYEGTVFSFDWGNTHFAFLNSNQFEINKGNCSGATNYISDAQITWLDNDLDQAQKRGVRHIFVTSHSNAYHLNSSPLQYLGSVNESQRNKFWQTLEKYDVTAYLTGHEHLFNDQFAQGWDGKADGNPSNKVVQWLNGNSGAPLDTSTSIFQYTVWSVNGNTVTAELIDQFGNVGYTRTFQSRQPTTP